MDYEAKALQVEIKAEGDQGLVVANFAAFDEKDRDGEITKRGAFGNQDVLLGAYGHTSFGRTGNPQPPIGIGHISEGKDGAVFEGEFNMKMTSGRDTFESVKMAGELQEWSYGFRVDQESVEKSGGQSFRVLEKLTVKEVSPVIIGAANNSHTTGIKSGGEGTLAKQSDDVLASVEDYLDRLKGLNALRVKEGRQISATNRERLARLQTSLTDIESDIADLLAGAMPRDTGDEAEDEKAALAIMADFERIRTGILGA